MGAGPQGLKVRPSTLQGRHQELEDPVLTLLCVGSSHSGSKQLCQDTRTGNQMAL